MKGFTSLILGIFGTLAFSWIGLAFIPNLQIGHLDPQTDEEGKDAYPSPKSGMAERGHCIYVANGCFYCHSQQVRPDYASSDIDRKWGERRSAPRDYIFDRPVVLGKERMGPDLSNVGKRAPAEEEKPAAPPAANAPAQSPSPPNAGPQKSPAAAASPPAASPAAAQSPAANQAPAKPTGGAAPPPNAGPQGPPTGAASPAAANAPAQSSPAPANPSPSPSAS